MDATRTYGGNMTTSDLDWIRFTIGDTDSTAPLLFDSEINATLEMQKIKAKAAKFCMEAVIIRLARECDYRVGPESVSASQRYDNYKAFYQEYKASMLAGSTLPQAPIGGSPVFGVGIMDSKGNHPFSFEEGLIDGCTD